MLSKMRITAIVAIVMMGFVGYALASPPVPAPMEGFGITTSVDVEMSSGDFTEVESFTWTWMNDPEDAGTLREESNSNLDGQRTLGTAGRAAEIRYTEELQTTDTSFFQFNKDFGAASGGADTEGNNLSVAKNYGYVASEASLIANASNQERVGLSIVANGDSRGLNDMPSLCPWVQDNTIPATNEFIAMGSETATTSVMVSDTDTEARATAAPELSHAISAQGIGMAGARMRLHLMEGDDAFDADNTNNPPDLISETRYSETTVASGTIERFNKNMNYVSTLPEWQMPEPWYQIQ